MISPQRRGERGEEGFFDLPGEIRVNQKFPPFHGNA
jgi:hypothetical protein